MSIAHRLTESNRLSRASKVVRKPLERNRPGYELQDPLQLTYLSAEQLYPTSGQLWVAQGYGKSIEHTDGQPLRQLRTSYSYAYLATSTCMTDGVYANSSIRQGASPRQVYGRL